MFKFFFVYCQNIWKKMLRIFFRFHMWIYDFKTARLLSNNKIRTNKFSRLNIYWIKKNKQNRLNCRKCFNKKYVLCWTRVVFEITTMFIKETTIEEYIMKSAKRSIIKGILFFHYYLNFYFRKLFVFIVEKKRNI